MFPSCGGEAAIDGVETTIATARTIGRLGRASAVDAHACAKLQSTAEWARQALLEKLTAEGFEVPPF